MAGAVGVRFIVAWVAGAVVISGCGSGAEVSAEQVARKTADAELVDRLGAEEQKRLQADKAFAEALATGPSGSVSGCAQGTYACCKCDNTSATAKCRDDTEGDGDCTTGGKKSSGCSCGGY
jgi:hypothetical protein